MKTFRYHRGRMTHDPVVDREGEKKEKEGRERDRGGKETERIKEKKTEKKEERESKSEKREMRERERKAISRRYILSVRNARPPLAGFEIHFPAISIR